MVTEEDVQRFAEHLARDLARPGDTRTIRSGTTQYRFRRRRAGGRITVTTSRIQLPVRPEVEEVARRVEGEPATDVPGADEFESQMNEALRQGASTYHIRSGVMQYTFGRWIRDGKRRGVQVVVAPARFPAERPEVQAYARQLQGTALCRRPDCRKPFKKLGKQVYCSPTCASTVRSRRARQ
jgi:hypothetical protein